MAKRKEKEDEKAIEKVLERHVPSDLVKRILYALPCKSLVRLMSTCKLWHSVATDPHFISSYQRRTVINPSHFLLSDEDCTRVHLFSLDVDSFNNVSSMVVPLDCPYDTMLPSSYGLACVYNSIRKKMVVFNPITQQIMNVVGMPPYFDPNSYLMGFGFHPGIKKYKAVVLSPPTIEGDIISGDMLNLHPGGCSIWRPVGTQDSACREFQTTMHATAVCADGVLYWGPDVLDRNFDILSFDLETKKFQWITSPRRSGRLINLQEKLCLFGYGRSDEQLTEWTVHIWMLTDSIHGDWTPFHRLNFRPELGYVFPLCIRHGKLILRRGPMFCSYDIEEKSLRVLTGEHLTIGQECGTDYCAHAETLVSIS